MMMGYLSSGMLSLQELDRFADDLHATVHLHAQGLLPLTKPLLLQLSISRNELLQLLVVIKRVGFVWGFLEHFVSDDLSIVAQGVDQLHVVPVLSYRDHCPSNVLDLIGLQVEGEVQSQVAGLVA